MRHVCLDKMTRSEGTAKGKFTSKHSSCDNASQSPRILTRRDGMRTTHTEHIEHGRLGLQNSAATQRANFNRRHRD